MSDPSDTSTPVMDATETVAGRVLRLRKAKGWTQREMAEFLGVGQSTVAGYEGGLPPIGPVVRLLDILEAESLPAAPETDMQPAAGPSAGATDDAPAAYSGRAA